MRKKKYLKSPVYPFGIFQVFKYLAAIFAANRSGNPQMREYLEEKIATVTTAYLL